jgi:hypothetical protein
MVYRRVDKGAENMQSMKKGMGCSFTVSVWIRSSFFEV